MIKKEDNNEDDELTNEEFFRELDYDYLGLRKLTDETYIYKAIDVKIQDALELPIIIQWPESTINFEFTIKPTEIYFSIYFVAAPETDSDRLHYSEIDIETVKDKEKVTCDELTEGTYKPPCEGVVFFVWDNSSDWSAMKNVSYKIEVIEPSFRGMEYERTIKSKEILKDIVEDNIACRISLADATDLKENIIGNTKILSSQLQTSKDLLAKKIAELERLEILEKELVSLVNDNLEKIPGLCIRSLNKHLLSIILGYLDTSITSPLMKVNKFWAKIVNDIRLNGPVEGTDYKYLATAKMRPRTIMLDDEMDNLYIKSIDDNDNQFAVDPVSYTKENENESNEQNKNKNNDKQRTDYINKKNHSDNEGESVYSDSETDDSGDAELKAAIYKNIKQQVFPVKEMTNRSENINSGTLSHRRVRTVNVFDRYPHLNPNGTVDIQEKADDNIPTEKKLFENFLKLQQKPKKKSKKHDITENSDKLDENTDNKHIDKKKITNESNEVDKVKEKNVKLPKIAESKTKAIKKAKAPKNPDDDNIRKEVADNDGNVNNNKTQATVSTTDSVSNSKNLITEKDFMTIMDIAKKEYQIIGNSIITSTIIFNYYYYCCY